LDALRHLDRDRVGEEGRAGRFVQRLVVPRQTERDPRSIMGGLNGDVPLSVER
jgi:hypothetical protein